MGNAPYRKSKEDRAISVFHRAFPGEWVMMAVRPDGSTEPLNVGDGTVNLIFGPYT